MCSSYSRSFNGPSPRFCHRESDRDHPKDEHGHGPVEPLLSRRIPARQSNLAHDVASEAVRTQVAVEQYVSIRQHIGLGGRTQGVAGCIDRLKVQRGLADPRMKRSHKHMQPVDASRVDEGRQGARPPSTRRRRKPRRPSAATMVRGHSVRPFAGSRRISIASGALVSVRQITIRSYAIVAEGSEHESACDPTGPGRPAPDCGLSPA